MPEKSRRLEKLLTSYLEEYNAENVMDFRKKRRKIIIEMAIPTEEKRLMQMQSDLKSAKGKERTELIFHLNKTEDYLKWLKNQIIFIDERSKLHL